MNTPHSNGLDWRKIFTPECVGWLLFVLSALFFIAASWRAGDWVGLSGGLLFLVSCFFFLYPMVKNLRQGCMTNRKAVAELT